ncbi:MAG: hypothetical protein EBZ62_06940, partial [Sphingobacteriia bacterium]|nr:hypothetical protein [Sphingobacteriia bacterium]
MKLKTTRPRVTRTRAPWVVFLGMLYPLRFRPVYLSKIWGGEHLATLPNRDTEGLPKVGWFGQPLV